MTPACSNEDPEQPKINLKKIKEPIFGLQSWHMACVKVCHGSILLIKKKFYFNYNEILYTYEDGYYQKPKQVTKTITKKVLHMLVKM